MLFEFKKKEIVHSCQSKAKCVMIKIIVAGASPTDIRMRRLLWQQRKIKDMEMKAFPHSKVRTVSESVRVSSSVLTDWRDANILFLRFSSNSIDEAREGFGNRIIVTTYRDHSIEVQDFGRGIPVDYNPKEERYNWELVFCELYAGGKYNTNQGESYEFSLGLNGLGSCATSTLPNILMPRFIGMVTVIICILKREKISED